MREYFKRVLASWAAFTGTLVEMATAIYTVGIITGAWVLPADIWQAIIVATTIVLAGLYKLFTIGNNPTNKTGF